MNFQNKNIPFEQEVKLKIKYKGVILKKEYVADFICYDSIILETKAVSKFSNEHLDQTLNYLKAMDFKLGLLVNFGAASLQYKRVVL